MNNTVFFFQSETQIKKNCFGNIHFDRIGFVLQAKVFQGDFSSIKRNTFSA